MLTAMLLLEFSVVEFAAYIWSERRTCGQNSSTCWVLSSTPTNNPHVSVFFATLTLLPLLIDHFFPCVCMCHEQLKRRSGDVYLNFEYMYNPPRPILDLRLQGTVHESHDHSCAGDVKRHSVGKIRVVVCVVDCVECVWLVNPGAWGLLYPR